MDCGPSDFDRFASANRIRITADPATANSILESVEVAYLGAVSQVTTLLTEQKGWLDLRSSCL